jgi:hypothetical protein
MADANDDVEQEKIQREAYLEELRTNCEIAVGAWRELQAEAGLNSLRSESAPENVPFTNRNIHAIWRCVYDIVEAVQRISLILWNTGECRALREELGVGRDSPLRNRDVRNAMQHLEERISSFIRDHPRMAIGGWRVSRSPRPDLLPNAAFLRHLNTFHWTLRVYDTGGFKECNVEIIMSAVIRLTKLLPKAGVSIHRVSGPYFIPDKLE